MITELTPEEIEERVKDAAEAARQERNYYLLQSDHIFCSDVQIENQDAWIEYRQKLRDLTEQPEFPKIIEWPERPER